MRAHKLGQPGSFHFDNEGPDQRQSVIPGLAKQVQSGWLPLHSHVETRKNQSAYGEIVEERKRNRAPASHSEQKAGSATRDPTRVTVLPPRCQQTALDAHRGSRAEKASNPYLPDADLGGH